MGLPALEPTFIKTDLFATSKFDLPLQNLSLTFDDHVLDCYKWASSRREPAQPHGVKVAPSPLGLRITDRAAVELLSIYSSQ